MSTAVKALDVILARRSIGRLCEPAPADDDVQTILRAGAAAPDHGELRPWSFVVLRGAGKDAFGEVLAKAYDGRCHEGSTEPIGAKREKERTKLGRAPLVIVVSVRRQAAAANPKIPWEDVVGAGYAACQNMLLAAKALGFDGMWRTGEVCNDDLIKTAMGLDADDVITGYLYLGTPYEGGDKPPHDPDLDGLVTEWSSPARP
ncbi:MAG: nitroreductase family protein [Acidimicrobiales bacterium]